MSLRWPTNSDKLVALAGAELAGSDMQLFAKLKKILCSGFRATLNFRKFKVVLKPLHRIFLTLLKVASQHADQYSIIKNGGHRARF